MEGGGMMEEAIFYLPLLEDGVITLGDMWDCRESKAVGSLFDTPLQADDLAANSIQKNSYTLSRMKNAKDRLSEFHISVELGLEALGGAVKVNGKASFDRDEKKGFGQEEIVCSYQADTSVIRLLNTNNASPMVREMLENGSLIATHYVDSIVLGGTVEASIKFAEDYDHSFMNLKGELSGTISLGPVTATARATLELLDDEYKDKYSTEITILSQPGIRTAPTTCKEMFAAIDTFDDVIKKEIHFPHIGQHITGVPIRFKMVPLSNFIRLGNPHTYKIMDPALLNKFQDAMLNLEDYCNLNFIKAEIREGVPPVVVLFQDLSHPLTLDLELWFKSLAIIGSNFKTEANTLLEKYKSGGCDEDNVAEFITRCESEFNLSEILEKIESYKVWARKELDGVNANDIVDVVDEGAPPPKNEEPEEEPQRLEDPDNEDEQPPPVPAIRFFTNQTELSEWYENDNIVKILFKTARDEEEYKSQILLKLYDISKKISSVGIEVGVAFPSISDTFSLTFKTKEFEKQYSEGNISFALELVGATVENETSLISIFYTVCGELFDINFPLVSISDLDGFMDNIKHLRFPINSSLTFCQSQAELLAKLLTTTDSLNFIIPLQAVITAYDQIEGYAKIETALQESSLKRAWMVPTLNIESTPAAPVILVFKDDVLSAVCMDAMDVAILAHILQQNNETADASLIDFGPLSLSKIKTSPIYVDRANFALDLESKLNQEKFVPIFEHACFRHSETPTLLVALKILRASCAKSNKALFSVVANLAMQDYGEELSAVLQNLGYINGTFITDKVDWTQVAEKIDTFAKSRTHLVTQINGVYEDLKNLSSDMDDEEMEIQLDAIVALIQHIANPSKKSLAKAGEEAALDELVREITRKVDKETQLSRRARITRAIQVFLSSVTTTVDYFNLTQLAYLCDEMATHGTLKNCLQSTVLAYVDQIAIEEAEIQEAIQLVVDAVSESNFYQALGLLSSMNQNSYMYKLQSCFHNINKIPKPTPVQDLLDVLLKFQYDEAKLQVVFSNPNFTYVLETVMENNAVMSSLNNLANNNDTLLTRHEHSIKTFIPTTIKDRIKKLEIIPEFPITQDWIALPGLTTALQTVLARGVVPISFLTLLHTNLEKYPALRQQLIGKQALPHYQERSNVFEYPWSIETVEYSLHKVIMDEHGLKTSTDQSPRFTKPQKTQLDIKYPQISKLDLTRHFDTWHTKTEISTKTGESPLQFYFRLQSLIDLGLPVPLVYLENKDAVKLSFLYNTLKRTMLYKYTQNPEMPLHPFQLPYKFVLTLRVGNSFPLPGRTSFLNKYILNGQSIFEELVSKTGNTSQADGYLDFVQLSKENTDNTFWDEIAKNEPHLLGNLHGDIYKLETWPGSLLSLSSCIIIFWSVKDWKELKSKRNHLLHRFNTYPKSNILDVILYPDSSIAEFVGDENLYFKDNEANNKTKLQNVMKNAFLPTPTTTSIQPSDEFYFTPAIGTPESDAILDFISMNSIPVIKESISTLDSDMARTLATLFTAVLNLDDDETRVHSLFHVKNTLALMSAHASEEFRAKVEHISGQIVTTSSTHTSSWRQEMLTELSSCEEQYAKHVLRMDDVFQLTSALCEAPDWFAHKYAACISSGFPCEFLSPKAKQLPDMVVSPMLIPALKLIPDNARIFVVSIVGSKQTGKTDLLSKLFGPACFHCLPTFGGMSLTLHPVSEEMKKQYQFDMFLVLDTAGIKAASLTDPDTRGVERSLVTAVLSMSDLSLVNILGDEFQNIFSALEMALLGIYKQNATANILLVQQRLIDTPDSSRTQIETTFKTMMTNVHKFVVKNDTKNGINSAPSLPNMISTYTRSLLGEIFAPISPKEHPTYDQDISTLFKMILEIVGESIPNRKLLGQFIPQVTHPLEMSFALNKSIFQYESLSKISQDLQESLTLQEIMPKMNIALLHHEKYLVPEFLSNLDLIFRTGYDSNFHDQCDKLLTNFENLLLSVVDNCQGESSEKQNLNKMDLTSCQACHLAYQSREEFLYPMRLRGGGTTTPLPQETHLAEYLLQGRAQIFHQLHQHILAREIKHRKSIRLADKVRDIIDQHGREAAYAKFLSWLSSRQTVLSHTERILQEVAEVYSEISSQFSLDAFPLMIDLTDVKDALFDAVAGVKVPAGKVDKNQAAWFHLKLEKCTDFTLKRFGEEMALHKFGMLQNLSDMIDELVMGAEEKWRCKLSPQFVRNLHTNGVTMLWGKLEKARTLWVDENSPVNLLKKVKAEFERDPENFFYPPN